MGKLGPQRAYVDMSGAAGVWGGGTFLDQATGLSGGRREGVRVRRTLDAGESFRKNATFSLKFQKLSQF